MLAQSLSGLSRGRSGRCNSVRVGAVQTVRCHACRNMDVRGSTSPTAASSPSLSVDLVCLQSQTCKARLPGECAEGGSAALWRVPTGRVACGGGAGGESRGLGAPIRRPAAACDSARVHLHSAPAADARTRGLRARQGHQAHSSRSPADNPPPTTARHDPLRAPPLRRDPRDLAQLHRPSGLQPPRPAHGQLRPSAEPFRAHTTLRTSTEGTVRRRHRGSDAAGRDKRPRALITQRRNPRRPKERHAVETDRTADPDLDAQTHARPRIS